MADLLFLSLRTGHAGFDPVACGLGGFCARQRREGTRAAVDVAAALPRPTDVGEMTPSRVALLRIIHRRVAVDAARMDEDGVDLLPGGESLGAARVTGWNLLGKTADSAETQKEREHGKTHG